LADARISSQNEDGGTLRDRLEDLRLKLQDVINLVVSSNGQIEEAKTKSTEAKTNVDTAKDIINTARDSLKVISNILYTYLVLVTVWF
jgi:methyl-accepting chemotaxis protein